MSLETRFVKAVGLAASIAALLPAFVWVASPFVGARLAGAACLGALACLHVAIVAARTVATPAHGRLRSLSLDLALTGVGLLAAGWLATPGLAGTVLALWGFALVQCLRLLAPGSRRVAAPPLRDDRFEAACARARELLESA